jgi:transformation/transcription domain-associated protein
VSPKEHRERQLEAYNHIVSSMISGEVFCQSVYKSLPTPNHTFCFRKQFCGQLALMSLFSYLFNCPACMPGKLLFAKCSGRVFLQDLQARYSQAGDSRHRALDLPYRFTRNFHNFFTVSGVEGWFLIAQVICARTLLLPKSELRWVLALFLRCAVYAGCTLRLQPNTSCSCMATRCTWPPSCACP